jgi:hypothetical protein
MKNRTVIPILSILIILSWSSQGSSLVEGTHQAINTYVGQNSINGFPLKEYLMNNLGLGKGVDEVISGVDADGAKQSRTVFWWLGYGGFQEDRPGSITDYLPLIGQPTRSINHFHNPLGGLWKYCGLDDTYVFHYTGQSSILWAQNPNQDPGGKWSWYDARDYFYKGLTLADKTQRDSAMANCFRAVGQLMHLVQDASVPAHSRSQIHILFNYETWVEKIRTGKPDEQALFGQFIAKPISFDPSILNLVVLDPSAPIPIANIIDTDKYSGSNPDVTAATAIGIAEYANANFLSGRTIFKNFPYPNKNTSVAVEDREVPDPRGVKPGVMRQYYIKRRDGESTPSSESLAEGKQGYRLAAVGFLKDYVTKYFPISSYNDTPALDGGVYNDYAEKLIPRAVGYSAGLLNYFFRGKLDVEQIGVAPSGEIEISITNLSEEPLADGTFELYYDNKEGERAKLELSAAGVKDLQKESTFTTSFRRPSDFETGKEDKYMLVYSGEMGLEEKAYIGKYGFIGRLFPVMVTYDQNEVKAFFKIAKGGEDERSHDFFIDFGPVLRELGHSTFSPVSLKIVEYSGMLGILVYTVNETTYCVLMFEVLGLSSPPVAVNGYHKRDFLYAYEQFDMSSAVLDPIPPIPECNWGAPGRPLGTAYHYFQKTRGDWTWGLAIGTESTFHGFEIHGPEGYEDLHWIVNRYADHLERTGVSANGIGTGDGPKTVAVPIGVSVWLTEKDGHLANIQWGIHFSCLAGYSLYLRGVASIKNEYDDESSGEGVSPWRQFTVPFMLVKEKGKSLVLQDTMSVFSSTWAVDGYLAGPITASVDYDPPGGIEPPPEAGEHAPTILGYNLYRVPGGRWPGSYRHIYPILGSNGVLSSYALHSTRLSYRPVHWASPFEDHFIDSLFIAAIDNQNWCTGIRPPGFYYDLDSTDFRSRTMPNGRFAFHAGGGDPNRLMLRIAPKSSSASGYDDVSGKDRSIYVIKDRIYDYLDPVPLLYGDSKVSRELLAAQSIYGMGKPPVLDSTINAYGDAMLTGRMEGYLDLEGYDGYRYFSDFGIIAGSALSDDVD